MKLNIERSVTVITPSVGSPKLKDAIQGVLAQTYRNVEHVIVADGPDEYMKVFDVVNEIEGKYPVIINLPYNTGANGFYGHRIYAGIPHLLNSDYIFFLDEDNWYDSDHVSTLVEVLDRGYDFAYSLRKVYRPDKSYVCDDNCESLGQWPIYFTPDDNPQHLIDTSAFAFKREFIQATCHLWHYGWGGDRRYFYAVQSNAKWSTSYKHTLCYRLDGNKGSVNEDFFIKGNAEQLNRYKGNLPWVKT